MSNERLFDIDPFSRIRTDFIWNDDGTFTLRTEQDLTETVAACKTRFDSFTGAEKWSEHGEYYGHIPNVFLDQMMRDGSIYDQKAIKRFFEENPAFRTRPGAL